MLPTQAPRTRSESTGGESGRTRLLLVDDDESFLEFAEELGRRQLVQILCARSAREALELVRSEAPVHGALIDVWLGSEVAFHLARELSKASGDPELPLAFVSGDPAALNRVAAAKAGASLFLSKPLTESQLAEAVTQLVALRHVKTARVLVVDADEGRRSRMTGVVSDCGFRAYAVQAASAALTLLDSAEYDAVLVGAGGRSMSGADLCRILRTNLRWQDVAVLILGPNDPASKLEAIRAGADDYVVEPVGDDELRARVKSRVERRQSLRARFERDGLTGLALRRSFVDSLRSRVSEAHRRNGTLAVCMLDLDHFKNINDIHGHWAGDRVLSNVGRLLSTDFREEDLRARWGGEEFALAFPGETAESIQPGIEDLLEDLKALEFTDSSGRVFHASFSAGLAEFPLDATTVEGLIRIADERLYLAKGAGRSRVVRTDWV